MSDCVVLSWRGPSGLEPEGAVFHGWQLTALRGGLLSVASLGGLLALFASRLTTHNWLVGLTASIADAGWYLPQAVTAHFLEGRRRLPIYRAMAVVRVASLAWRGQEK